MHFRSITKKKETRKKEKEKEKESSHITSIVTAIHFWVGVTESGLLGTCVPGSGVRDKGLVGTEMDAERKNGAHKDMCSTMFTAALFVIARSCKQCRCPSTEE